MPFEILREPHGVHKRFTGVVTPEEFMASVFANHSDPDYDHLHYSINDFLNIDGNTVDSSVVTKAAAYSLGAAYINPAVRVAVVTIDPQVKALVERFITLTRYEVAFFDTVEVARAWGQAGLPVA